MDATSSNVRITFRIPGNWAHPGELIERLPPGFKLTPDALTMPDGSQVEFSPMPPDGQFAQVFASSCRRPASSEEMEIVDSYTVNVILSGPGGSKESALRMMRAAAAITAAGAGGVFIDNCTLAHGAVNWMAMTDDGGPDAISFAFAAIVRGDHQVWTMGMHVMGQPDVLMQRADADANEDSIIDVIRYLARGEKPIGDGHLLADQLGRPMFHAVSSPSNDFEPGTPMHNPFGRLQLVSMKDIAEGN